MAFVYRHIRLDKNEPFYIGISKDQYRPYATKNRSKYWARIVNKSDYRVEILFDDLTYEQAKEKEIEFISLYGRKDLNNGCLVNMTDGEKVHLMLWLARKQEGLFLKTIKAEKDFHILNNLR